MFEKTLTSISVSVIAGLILAAILYGVGNRYKLLGWLLRLRDMRNERSYLLVYLSSGGTCRDPMAAAITRALIDEHYPSLAKVVRIEGGALGPASNSRVSFAARHAIKEIYGRDILREYVPREVMQQDLDSADLVLVMSCDLMNSKKLPPGRSYVFKEFFGGAGDIADPWPDGRDEQTIARYQQVAEEIKSVLEANSNMGKLLNGLGARH